LTRKQLDAPWMAGVESAAVGPRQFIRPGEVVQLENPYAAQPAGFSIRVLYELEQGHDLLPKVSQVQNQRFAHFAADVDGVVVSAENPRDEDLWLEKDLPSLSTILTMAG